MDLKERPVGVFARHPWELARASFFLRTLRVSGSLRDARQVLDVGSGDAWFASQLAEELPPQGQIVCWDTGYEAQSEPAGSQRDPRLTLTATAPKGRFDLALLLDVAEHVQDDRGFLAQLVTERLQAGARVLFSVPAWPELFSEHDRALGHFRRYRPQQARELLAAAGLSIVQSGGLFHGLLGPRALGLAADRLWRRERRSAPRALAWQHGRALTAPVSAVLGLDTALSTWLARRGLDAPGLSWWALCEKSL